MKSGYFGSLHAEIVATEGLINMPTSTSDVGELCSSITYNQMLISVRSHLSFSVLRQERDRCVDIDKCIDIDRCCEICCVYKYYFTSFIFGQMLRT